MLRARPPQWLGRRSGRPPIPVAHSGPWPHKGRLKFAPFYGFLTPPQIQGLVRITTSFLVIGQTAFVCLAENILPDSSRHYRHPRGSSMYEVPWYPGKAPHSSRSDPLNLDYFRNPDFFPSGTGNCACSWIGRLTGSNGNDDKNGPIVTPATSAPHYRSLTAPRFFAANRRFAGLGRRALGR